MTMLLAHPEAENLGRFVEGTLDDPERAAVVQHIADCDECRILVVDAAEFIEPARVASSHWWLGIAAAVVLVALLGGVSFNHFRDPLATVEKTYSQLPSRPLAARLSGFRYVRQVVNRGTPGAEEDVDPAAMILKSQAGELTHLSGSDSRTLHARGIGFLLSEDDPKESIAPLQAAAESDPNNATYQSDLAAALITTARGNAPMLERALAVCGRALRIDPHSPDVLFNRAVALQQLGRPDAVAAYQRYLKVDSTSPWADEARGEVDLLRAR
jgi:hypothetical protein